MSFFLKKTHFGALLNKTSLSNLDNLFSNISATVSILNSMFKNKTFFGTVDVSSTWCFSFRLLLLLLQYYVFIHHCLIPYTNCSLINLFKIEQTTLINQLDFRNYTYSFAFFVEVGTLVVHGNTFFNTLVEYIYQYSSVKDHGTLLNIILHHIWLTINM